MPRPLPVRRRHAAALAVAAVACTLLASACTRPEEPAPQFAGGACPPGQFCGAQPGTPQQPGMPPGAPAPPPAGPPAMGLPCAGDLDFQCPFGRCVSGRCGGCTGHGDCKGAAHCGWTPLGMSCLPGAAPAGPSPAPLPPGQPPIAGGGSGSFASARQLCVDRTNQLRASVGARPLTRVFAAEPCLDAQAAHDGSVGAAHAAFGRCNEGAQNVCPGWAGPPDSMVGPCLKMMFDEGPGSGPAHGHYTNMVDAKYSGVACGFSVLPDGRVWMVQDFF